MLKKRDRALAVARGKGLKTTGWSTPNLRRKHAAPPARGRVNPDNSPETLRPFMISLIPWMDAEIWQVAFTIQIKLSLSFLSFPFITPQGKQTSNVTQQHIVRHLRRHSVGKDDYDFGVNPLQNSYCHMATNRDDFLSFALGRQASSQRSCVLGLSTSLANLQLTFGLIDLDQLIIC